MQLHPFPLVPDFTSVSASFLALFCFGRAGEAPVFPLFCLCFVSFSLLFSSLLSVPIFLRSPFQQDQAALVIKIKANTNDRKGTASIFFHNWSLLNRKNKKQPNAIPAKIKKKNPRALSTSRNRSQLNVRNGTGHGQKQKLFVFLFPI